MVYFFRSICFFLFGLLLPILSSAQWQPFLQVSGMDYIGNAAYQVFGSRLLALDSYRGPCYSDNGGRSWQKSTNGPTTNQVRSLIRQDNKAYVAYSRQLYVTADTGRTWSTFGAPLPEDVQCFAISNKRMVALTFKYPWEVHLYLSNDQGQSWQLSSSFNAALSNTTGVVFNHFLLAIVGETIFAGTDAGLWVSVDAGQSWTLGLKKAITYVSASPTDVFVGTDDALYASTDVGKNWKQVLAIYQTSAFFRQGDLYFVSGSGNRTFSSYDRGNTWNDFSKGLPFDSQSSANSYYTWNDSLRLGGYLSNGSTSGGYGNGAIIWARALSEVAPSYLEAPTVLYSINGYRNDPEPRDRTMLNWTDNSTDETGFVVERSENDGQTFRVLVTLPANSTTYLDKTLQIGVNYYYRIRAVNSFGMSRPSNTVWVVKPVVCTNADQLTASLLAAAFPTEAVGYICGESGTLLKTEDGGRTWCQLRHPAKNSTLRTIQFINEQTGFVGSTLGLMRTLDGGLSWTLYRIPGNFEHGIGQIYFINANRGFITEYQDGYGTVYFTENGGQSWSILSNAQNNRRQEVVNSLVFPDSLTGYLAGNNGLLLKTVDGGKKWKDLNAGTPLGEGHLTKLVFVDNRRGYVILGSKLLRTEDGGTSWRSLNLPTSITVQDLKFLDWTHGILLTKYDYTRRAQFFQTDNAGETWTALPQSFSGVNSVPTLMGLATHGQTVWAVGHYGELTRSLFVSHDAGRSWQVMTGDQAAGNILSLAFRTRQEGILLKEPFFDTPPNTYYLTLDAGEIWQQRTLPGASGGALAAVHFFNAQTGVIVGESALWRTVNGGQNWQRYTTNRRFTWWGGSAVDFQYITFLSELEWTCRDKDNKRYRSTDGGLTWNLVSTNPSLFNDGFTFNNVSYGSTLNGVRTDFSYTTDGGKTWKPGKCRTVDAPTIGSVRMISSSVAYAFETNYPRMLKTTDGGANWYPTQYEWWETTFGGNVLAFFADGTVYAASNYGNRLIRFSPGTSPSVETYRTGPTTRCLNEVGTYQTYSDPGRLYHWTLPEGGGNLEGDREKVSITWTSPGKHVLRLVVEDGCGASPPSDQIITVFPGPLKPVISIADSLLVSSYPGKNEWFFNGGSVYGYGNQPILPLKRNQRWQQGLYYVVAVDSLGCRTGSDSLRFAITGLELAPGLANQIHVYPNPVQDVVHIQFTTSLPTEATVALYSVQGALLQTHKFQRTQDIPFSTLPVGIYLLRVQTAHGEATYRLLKQF